MGAPLRTAAIANGAPPDVADVPVRLLARTLVCDERHLRARRSRMRVNAASQLRRRQYSQQYSVGALTCRETCANARVAVWIARAIGDVTTSSTCVCLAIGCSDRACANAQLSLGPGQISVASPRRSRPHAASGERKRALERRCLLPARFGERRVEVLRLVIWVEAGLAWQRNVSPSAECTPPGATAQAQGERARAFVRRFHAELLARISQVVVEALAVPDEMDLRVGTRCTHTRDVVPCAPVMRWHVLGRTRFAPATRSVPVAPLQWMKSG